MTTIVWIHGHTGSKNFANYLKQGIPEGCYDHHFLEYDSKDGAIKNLARMQEEVAKIDDDLFFVTHSKGGAYAAYLVNANFYRTIGGVSISCPWLGSENAYMMQMLDHTSVIWKDIAPSSDFIRGVQQCALGDNWTSVITTLGKSNLIPGDNDGVLSRASMSGYAGIKYVEIAATHGEVLLNDVTVLVIQEALAEAEYDKLNLEVV